MPGVFGEWEDTTVQVRVPTGRDRYGNVTTKDEPAVGQWEGGSQLVRAADGTERVSSARFHCGPQYRALLVPGREVVVPGGAVAEVLSVSDVPTGDPDLDGLTVALA